MRPRARKSRSLAAAGALSLRALAGPLEAQQPVVVWAAPRPGHGFEARFAVRF
jgi:hypothetical protein